MLDLVHGLYSTVLPFVLVLSVLVFVHELGHYLVARWNGVKVEVFSIGFGPEIFGWTDAAQTRWKVCLVPLGGYVKMLSDLNPSSQPDLEKISAMSEAEKSQSLFHKTVGQRMAVSVAGPLANYLLAIVILTGLYITVGQRVPSEVAKIGMVAPHSAAQEAGLEVKDVVTHVNQAPISSFKEMQEMIRTHAGKPLSFTVRRAQETLIISATPHAKQAGAETIGVLGIAQGSDNKVIPFYKAPLEATLDTIRISGATLSSLWAVVTGKQSADGLSGPIGIAAMTGEVARQGVVELFWLAAFLSISLGLINLFPVPMLDGGHLLFYGIEAVRGKALSEKTQEFLYRIGFSIVAFLIIVSTWNDLMRLSVFSKIKAFIGL